MLEDSWLAPPNAKRVNEDLPSTSPPEYNSDDPHSRAFEVNSGLVETCAQLRRMLANERDKSRQLCDALKEVGEQCMLVTDRLVDRGNTILTLNTLITEANRERKTACDALKVKE
jgi:hypothetical protein